MQSFSIIAILQYNVYMNFWRCDWLNWSFRNYYLAFYTNLFETILMIFWSTNITITDLINMHSLSAHSELCFSCKCSINFRFLANQMVQWIHYVGKKSMSLLFSWLQFWINTVFKKRYKAMHTLSFLCRMRNFVCTCCKCCCKWVISNMLVH